MKRNISLPWLAAIALTIAVLTAGPAAAGTAVDYPEDRLKFVSVAAYSTAADQPVDLYARVVDEQGSPIDGAAVTVDVSAAGWGRPHLVHLQNEGNGVYKACDAPFVEAAIGVTVYEFTATMDRMHPAFASVKSDRGNLCGSRPQIHIASLQAAKLDGPGQPLSVVVELVDDSGNPVTGADVMVQVTSLRRQIEIYLPEASGGRYADCDVALLDTTGAGQIGLVVYASAPGYAPATARTVNTVGYLCANLEREETTASRAQ